MVVKYCFVFKKLESNKVSLAFILLKYIPETYFCESHLQLLKSPFYFL